MLFPRIDVKDCLLRGSGIRMAGRHVEQVEIDISESRSEAARNLLERGRHQDQRYQPDLARILYCDAATAARRHKDGLVEAAAIMSQTILMDGMSPGDSQIQFLGEALEVLDFDLFCLDDQLLIERTPRAKACEIRASREALRDLIQRNRLEYQLRQDSLLIAETRVNIDRHLAAGDWLKAKNVAGIGRQNVNEMFGADHWWTAVMMARLATALLRLQEVDKAKALVSNAGAILDEWTDFASSGDVFRFERDMLSVAKHDIALMTA